MRSGLVIVVFGACGFSVKSGTSDDARIDQTGAIDATDATDAADDAADDAPDGSVSAVCGNGVVESGEECEIGTTMACGTTCGESGTATCTNTCTAGACVVTVSPATDWEMGLTGTGTTWTTAALPNTGWPCDNCSRFFRTTVCSVPTAVEFRWASDNRARMRINGTIAFDQFWLTGYCTDATCCTKCCDSTPNCMANLSTVQTLDAADLGLFTVGTNVMVWEVEDETGGAGFHSEMTITY